MFRSHFIPAIVILLALATGFATAEEKKFEKKFQVSAGGTLALTTDVGSVTVTGGSGTEVIVSALIEGRRGDVEKFVIEAQQVGPGVEVTGKMPKSFWRLLQGSNFDVSFAITIPRNYNVRLHTAGGNVSIANVNGKIEGENSGGDVTLKQSEGNANLGTSGGNIHAESVKGDLVAETSGGDIRVKTVTGSIKVETSGGNIAVEDVDGKVFAETSGGNVVLKVRGVNKGIHADTSGGNVTIAIGKSVGATIDAATSGGEVECDLPVTVSGKISESRIKGTLNGGGELIYAHTSGGDVRIKALD